MEQDYSFDVRARGWDCPQCPATADEPCRTPRGARAQHSHHQRVKKAKAYAATQTLPSAHPALRVACPTCHVPKDQLCRTTHGKPRPANYCHEERTRWFQANTSVFTYGPHVRITGTTAHVYLPPGVDHIIIGRLDP